MQTVQILLGFFLIVLIYLDFFHTTLSGNGFGIFSKLLNRGLNRLIIKNKSRRIFAYSGITHLLVTSFMWLALLFLGAFVVFTAGEQLVVDGTTGLPATKTERFYYTAYMLSTVGIGDFVPGNDPGRVLSAILSFSGFILVTTGLTYLLSVVNAVLSKKKLSFLLATLGEDVEEIYSYLKEQDELSSLVSDAASLKQQILDNASSYLAFPMVNYFLSRERNSALVLQLAGLYEVLMVIRQDWEANSIQYNKISSIIKAIEMYLDLSLEKPKPGDHNAEKLHHHRSIWKKYGYNFQNEPAIDKQFTSILQYAGWSWKDVYKLKEEQK